MNHSLQTLLFLLPLCRSHVFSLQLQVAGAQMSQNGIVLYLQHGWSAATSLNWDTDHGINSIFKVELFYTPTGITIAAQPYLLVKYCLKCFNILIYFVMSELRNEWTISNNFCDSGLKMMFSFKANIQKVFNPLSCFFFNQWYIVKNWDIMFPKMDWIALKDGDTVF